MKILINGCELKEILELESKIKKLKRNKETYQIAVVLIAIWIDSTTLGNALGGLENISNLQSHFSQMFNTIIDLLLFVSKYGCMAMGLREMGVTMLNGGNIKDAIFKSLNFWVAHWFATIYPTIF